MAIAALSQVGLRICKEPLGLSRLAVEMRRHPESQQNSTRTVTALYIHHHGEVLTGKPFSPVQLVGLQGDVTCPRNQYLCGYRRREAFLLKPRNGTASLYFGSLEAANQTAPPVCLR